MALAGARVTRSIGLTCPAVGGPGRPSICPESATDVCHLRCHERWRPAPQARDCSDQTCALVILLLIAVAFLIGRM